MFFIIASFHSSFELNSDIPSNKINLLGLNGGIIQISTLNNCLSKSLDFSIPNIPVTPYILFIFSIIYLLKNE